MDIELPAAVNCKPSSPIKRVWKREIKNALETCGYYNKQFPRGSEADNKALTDLLTDIIPDLLNKGWDATLTVKRPEDTTEKDAVLSLTVPETHITNKLGVMERVMYAALEQGKEYHDHFIGYDVTAFKHAESEMKRIADDLRAKGYNANCYTKMGKYSFTFVCSITANTWLENELASWKRDVLANLDANNKSISGFLMIHKEDNERIEEFLDAFAEELEAKAYAVEFGYKGIRWTLNVSKK